MIQSNFGLDGMREIEERSWSWSDASQDLLQLILKFLTPLNHLRFGSVCRSWRIAQRECLHPPAQDLPFYIVCGDINDYRCGESIELYSFTEKKIYKKPMHRLCFFTRKFSIPNSGGWFVLYDLNEEIFFLFNPFIPYGCIDLPRQESRRYNERLFFSTPAHPDGLLLLIHAYSDGNKFLQCRLNPRRSDHQYYEWQEPFTVSDWDKDWDKETCPAVMSNAIFFQGKLYALNEDGNLSVVDTLFPHDFTVLKMKLERTDSARSAPPVEWHHHAVIVESCGEMLLVFRVGEYRNRIVAVYRANLTELEWVKVENLGDRAILIFNESNSVFNERNSVSVCTNIETDFRSNWVYYFSSFSRKRVLVRYKELELGGDGLHLFESPTDGEDEYFSDGEYFSIVTDGDSTDDEYGLTLLFPS